jgi:hypothetical protein
VTGYLAGLVQRRVLKASWWIAIVTAAVGSAFGVGAFLLAAALVDRGQPLDHRLLTVIGVVAFINAVGVLPALGVVRRAVPPDPVAAGYLA